jgi:hypothetical protein
MYTNLVGLIAEEMNFLKLLVFDVAQAVCLVPAMREDIKRDLTADRVGETIVGELLLQCLNKCRANACLLLGFVSASVSRHKSADRKPCHILEIRAFL